jgi:hypothetical protein
VIAADGDAGAWRGTVVARNFAGGASVCHVELDGPSVELATTDRSVREGDRVGVRLTGAPVALVADEGTDADGRAFGPRSRLLRAATDR